MSINQIDKKIKKLQKDSLECSKRIIELKVQSIDNLEYKEQLFLLECKSKKIVEEIKILKQTKQIIKHNKHY